MQLTSWNPITFFFFFSSTSLLLPTHLSPPSCTHAQPRNPMDCSPPGSSVHGLFQARILEWVAISFSAITFCRHLLKHFSVLLLWFPFLILENYIRPPALRIVHRPMKS